MRICQVVRIVAVTVLCLCASACATKTNTNTNTNTAKANGHWETLPPVTGSMLPRKVWVDDSGNASNPNGSGNVQTSSGAALERAQRTSGAMRPPGQ